MCRAHRAQQIIPADALKRAAEFQCSATWTGATAASTVTSEVTCVPNLTREAKELLLEAVAGGGDIHVNAWMGGSTVQAKVRNFVEPNDLRSCAIWEGAVNELE